MAKSQTKTYIVLKEYHTLEGVVSPGEEVKLTAERALQLTGKVRVKTRLESAAGEDLTPKLNAANKRVEQLEGDVESLEADKTSLTADLAERDGQLAEATQANEALTAQVAELEGQLAEATAPVDPAESGGGDGEGDNPAANKTNKNGGGKNNGKNNN